MNDEVEVQFIVPEETMATLRALAVRNNRTEDEQAKVMVMREFRRRLRGCVPMLDRGGK